MEISPRRIAPDMLDRSLARPSVSLLSKAGGGLFFLALLSGAGCSGGGSTLPVNIPAADRVVFQSDRDGDNEIFLMNGDGSGQIQLTNNAARDVEPAFSPDGRTIVFTSNRDGNNEIYIMNADGSGQRRLTANSFSDDHACFTRDGRYIVFDSLRLDGSRLNSDIYVMNANGTGERRLTTAPTFEDQPAVDARNNVIFRSNAPAGFFFQIYKVALSGGTPVALTDETSNQFQPAFSPDGRKIAFTSDRDGSFQIYTMNADGTAQTRLTSDAASNFGPAFSPDGRRISFSSNVSGNFDVFTANADGSGAALPLTTGIANDRLPDVR